jgi:GT2 family glycosyltransferase
MRVHTIILNWNGWRDTVKCLRSLNELECLQTPIVIDNGSTDDSVAKIRELFPQVELVETGANLGFGGGCNIGIWHALSRQCDYVWLLNNDTIVEPKSLAALIEVAKSDPKIGAVGSVIYHMENPSRVQIWGGWHVRMLLGTVSRHSSNMPIERLHFISGASCLLRAEAIRSVGLFDEGFFMYWEDADLGFRLRKGGWKLAVADKSQIWHKGCVSLGKRNPVLGIWNNISAARFFHRYARVPGIPLFVGGARSIAKRLVIGDLRGAAAVIKGLVKGVSKSITKLEHEGHLYGPVSGPPAPNSEPAIRVER